MKILSDGDVWEIVVGGCCQPEWTAKGESLEEAIQDLVKQVACDAIEDEAREWIES